MRSELLRSVVASSQDFQALGAVHANLRRHPAAHRLQSHLEQSSIESAQTLHLCRLGIQGLQEPVSALFQGRHFLFERCRTLKLLGLTVLLVPGRRQRLFQVERLLLDRQQPSSDGVPCPLVRSNRVNDKWIVSRKSPALVHARQ